MNTLILFSVIIAALFYSGYNIIKAQKQAAKDLGTFDIPDEIYEEASVIEPQPMKKAQPKKKTAAKKTQPKKKA